VPNFLYEWGFAIPNDKPPLWIDNQWLDISQPISLIASSNPVLLFGKKLFSKDDETDLLLLPPYLLSLLFNQLLSMYLTGMFFCSAYKAVRLSALSAYNEISTSSYLTSGSKWLQSHLPPRLQHYPLLPSLISKNMNNIGDRSTSVVQTAFLKGLMKIDTFGLTMYSAKIDSECGILGIGYKSLYWMDNYTFEPLEQWPNTTLDNLSFTSSGIRISFINSREMDLETLHAADISRLIYDVTGIEAKRSESYMLMTGSDDESHNGLEIVPLQVQTNHHHPYPRNGSNHKQTPNKTRQSPINRGADRRKAFRNRKRSKPNGFLDSENSIEVLSELMETDFTTCKTGWKKDEGNPIYDSIASAHIDSTLKLSKLTYPALSQTLKWNKKTNRRKVKVLDDPQPPPLPPKHFRFTTKSNINANNIINDNNDEDEEIPLEYAQRLGAYVVSGVPTMATIPDLGQKSRLVQPNEAHKDYATLRREFRIFCVKMPNGTVHWELASLYQPIYKLIARLCILIHSNFPDQFDLSVEGSILTQLKEMSFPLQDTGSDDHQTSSSRDLTPSPSNGLESLKPMTPSAKNYMTLPNQGRNIIKLDPKLTFKDYNIKTSRLLSLSFKNTFQTERLPRITIKVPDWVKFHQCWLSIVHGNQPCTLQDAITLAAILYQCYVLDRSEASSVISFCNVFDFLPPVYANVKGIEEKVLRERDKLLNYNREELQQIYIRGTSTSPLYQTVFFPCKEPRRQFFSNCKMVPIYIGINQQGVMRVDSKSRQILDIWTYEVFQNWGYTRKSFLLAFDSSTYPIKTNQGKWMTELINFHVNNIVKIKDAPPSTRDEVEPLTDTETNPSSSSVSRPYFLLEAPNGDNMNTTTNHNDEVAPIIIEEIVVNTEELPNKNSPYFVLEKVYEELLQTRSEMAEIQRQAESLYVNPHPNCSLITPDEVTVKRMKKLGLLRSSAEPQDETRDEDEVQEEQIYDEVCTDTSLEWDSLDDDDYDAPIYDDIINFRQSPEHIYDLPPDC
jgi:hypothetical protein